MKNLDIVIGIALLAWACAAPQAHAQLNYFSDFNDGVPDWGKKGSTGTGRETNGQLSIRARFPGTEGNPAWSSAWLAWPANHQIRDGETLEYRVDLINASQSNVFAGFDYNATGIPGEGLYVFIKDANNIQLTKFIPSVGIGAQFFDEATPVKHHNVTMSMALSGASGSVWITCRVLDKEADGAVLFERTVVDTPGIDPVVDGPDYGPPFGLTGSSWALLYLGQVTDGTEPEVEVLYDNFTWEYREATEPKSDPAPGHAVELFKLTADDGAAYDFFGRDVAVNPEGTLLVVGAEGQDDWGENAGLAYIFERTQGQTNWTWRYLFGSDISEGDLFGRTVAVSGEVIAVGTYSPNSAGGGAVYVFERNNGGQDNWGEVVKLTGEENDRFGIRVELSGNTLLVAAPQDDEVATDSGACLIFQRDHPTDGAWGLVKKIKAPDADAADRMRGHCLSGNTLIASSSQDDEAGANAGAVYIFERDEGGIDNWGFVKKLLPPHPEAGARFGSSPSLSGDLLVVGARFADEIAPDSGAAYLFERNQGGPNNWGFVKKLLPHDGVAQLVFGGKTAADGDFVAVAGHGNPNNLATTLPGAVYLYGRNQGGSNQWGLIDKLEPANRVPGDADSAFGASLDSGDGYLAVGSWYDDLRGLNAGSVHLFRLFQEPSLSITQSGPDVQLTWPEISDVSFFVEQTQSASSPDWQPLPGGTTSPVTVKRDQTEGYFRLQMEDRDN